MTPAELYKIKPESTDHDIDYLIGCYYNFIPEITEEDFKYTGSLSKNTRIEVLTYKYFDFDGRRIWRLAAIKLDGDFVMITQNAGREGDDYTGRFVTNEAAYLKMIKYIRSLLPIPEQEMDDVITPDSNIINLTRFYGNELDGCFERY